MTQHILAIHSYLLSPINGLIVYVKELKKSYDYARAVRSTIKELSSLSNQELNDIGLTRGDIYSVAHNVNSNLKGWV